MKYELIHLICLAEGFTLKNNDHSNNTIVNSNNSAAGDAIYPGESVLITRKWKSLSHIWLFVTLWTIQSVEFSRPQYWSG